MKRSPRIGERGGRSPIHRSGEAALRLSVLALAVACICASGCSRSRPPGREPEASAGARPGRSGAVAEEVGMPASDAARAGDGAGARAPDSLATVERMLLAHHVRPDESLAVRLVGTVGPNGSWALDRVEVQQSPGRVVLFPRLRRVPGDFFIESVIPLDHSVSLRLPAGTYRVEARSRGGTLGDTVTVAADARRAPPEIRLERGEPAAVQADLLCPARFVAEVTDGFVDRVEIRETVGGRATPWRAPESVERDGASLRGSLTVRRPAADPERRLEARATDGQGRVSATAILVLLAR